MIHLLLLAPLRLLHGFRFPAALLLPPLRLRLIEALRLLPLRRLSLQTLALLGCGFRHLYVRVRRSNNTSCYGSSCANNGKGAINTPEGTPQYTTA